MRVLFALERVESLEGIVCFVYFSAAHSNAQLPVLTRIEAILQESANVSFQGLISSHLLVDIEVVIIKKIIYRVRVAKIRCEKFDTMRPLIY